LFWKFQKSFIIFCPLFSSNTHNGSAYQVTYGRIAKYKQHKIIPWGDSNPQFSLEAVAITHRLDNFYVYLSTNTLNGLNAEVVIFLIGTAGIDVCIFQNMNNFYSKYSN
jgi:hypothetical protein